MGQPLVSVVIPFYSGVAWLKEAIRSVLSQTYNNFEVLVINDGSSENLEGVIQEYGERIKIIKKPNGGPASARNLGIELAKGKYIAFLDSDDIWLPKKLSTQINEMEKNNYIWSHHSYEMFWENSDRTKLINTNIHRGEVFRDCYISFRVQTSTVVVLKQILVDYNIRFPLNKRYGQDSAFYKQIAKDFPIGFINGVYAKFRIRGSNAGFRAFVQLNDKAATWKEIKNDNEVLNILPSPIIFAYKFCAFVNRWNYMNYLKAKEVNNEYTRELLSKFLYIFPYSIFRNYSKKLTKR
jgi:glycosyltransferase involved in cell wall biosynthesis